MALCCLCRDPVSSDHRRRKKLHGAGCSIAMTVICNLSSVPVDSYVEIRDPLAVLCYTCERKLNNIHTLEEKLQNLKADVNDKLSVLQSSVVLGAIGKRTRAATDTATGSQADEQELPDPKQSRTETQTPSSTGQTVTTVTEPAGPSPDVQVVIPYKHGPHTYKIHTPRRKKAIKRITRKSYVSMASAMINSPTLAKSVISQVANKVKTEMKDVSSGRHDSILRDTVEAVKRFSWETVNLELTDKVPTLMALLSQLVPYPSERKPLLCFLASVILKARHKHLCLVQRAVSVMMYTLYGNGTAKQVFTNMQPLNVCLSHVGSMNIVEKISEGHDVEVQEWSDRLLPLIKNPSQTVHVDQPPVDHVDLSSVTLADLYDDSSSDETEDDIVAPSFSSLSSGAEDDDDHDDTATKDLEDEDGDGGALDQSVDEMETSTVTNDEPNQESTTEVQEDTGDWTGYKFVGDNIDKNVKPSFQRNELRGMSLHHFHGFAVRDQVNLSGLSDERPPYATPDASLLLPTSDDISSLKDEFDVLISRQVKCCTVSNFNYRMRVSDNLACFV